jgi:hypothetical protein
VLWLSLCFQPHLFLEVLSHQLSPENPLPPGKQSVHAYLPLPSAGSARISSCAAGEWVGSLAGSLLMGLVLVVGFGAERSTLKLSAALFVANSVGYFLGSALNERLGGGAGMLLWGGVYGLCPGAGLGAVIHSA